MKELSETGCAGAKHLAVMIKTLSETRVRNFTESGHPA